MPEMKTDVYKESVIICDILEFLVPKILLLGLAASLTRFQSISKSLLFFLK